MKTEIEKLYAVWEQTQVSAPQPIDLKKTQFNEIVSSIYTAGPSYYYILDLSTMSVSHMSPGIKEIHGLEPEKATFNDILSLIHPEDMDYVARAEAKLIEIFQHKVGVCNFTKYKTCYSFRFKTANGDYRLFLHQALVLTIDDKGGVSKALNIHTDISHISTGNNYRVSFIGLQGEPSYLNIAVDGDTNGTDESFTVYTRRETQIIKLLAKGLSNPQISAELNIALDTVKNHRRNILKKAGVKNLAMFIKKSILEGLI